MNSKIADPVENSPAIAFRAFDPSYLGGASLATADFGSTVNGQFDRTAPDGRAEIVVGSGNGMPPQVKTYDVSGAPRVVDSFLPLANRPRFRGGVSVSTGRYDADATPDIVVAGGRGASSQFEIWSGQAGTEPQRRLLRSTAFADLARANAAVYAANLDLDGDGRLDRIYSTQGDGGESLGVRSLTNTGSLVDTLGASPQNVRIAASSVRRPVSR